MPTLVAGMILRSAIASTDDRPALSRSAGAKLRNENKTMRQLRQSKVWHLTLDAPTTAGGELLHWASETPLAHNSPPAKSDVAALRQTSQQLPIRCGFNSRTIGNRLRCSGDMIVVLN